MKRQGANKKLYKRKGKSYEEVYDFEIQSFLGGGQYGGETTSSDSITFGVGKRGQTESYTSTKTSENRGIDSSVSADSLGVICVPNIIRLSSAMLCSYKIFNC